MSENIELLVQQANKGDKQALEAVILSIKDLVYNLSVKMLLFPEDAEDATQEILVKIVTHLSTFRSQSKFSTWVYRIATNYLITTKGKKSSEFTMDFQEYAVFIDSGHSDQVTTTENAGEIQLLEEEVKISCTQGLLLCLDTAHRMTYILGVILEFNSKEGGTILSITPATFRQQLSRSKKKIKFFLQSKCGLVNPENPCRCLKKIDFLSKQQLIDLQQLRFAPFSNRSIELMKKIEKIENEQTLYQSNPDLNAPEILINKMKELIKTI